MPQVTMRRHATQQTATLLRRLAYNAGRASKAGGADSVHDLRVSIRRLAQCLLVFGQYFPRGKTKKIHARLKQILDLASEVRNRDVATVLLAPESDLAPLLARERREASRLLTAALKRWTRRNSYRKWRSRLDL
jgi:CHAD domain-containing protein